MTVGLFIVLGIAFGVAIFALIIWVVVRQASRTADAWKSANPEAEVLLTANGANCAAFPGIEGTLRGNGLLVLTKNELHFWMWGIDKRLMIPLRDIKFVGTTRKFAGKLGRLPMLHIGFHERGDSRETAWTLANASSWVEEIERIKDGVIQ